MKQDQSSVETLKYQSWTRWHS